MKRLLSLAALGLALAAADPALAQPGRGPARPGPAPRPDDTNKKLEAQLDQLQAKLTDLERKLARLAEADRGGRTDGGRMGPGPRGPMGGPSGMGRGFGPPGRDGFRRPGSDDRRGPEAGRPGPDSRGGPGAGRGDDVQRRIDRIIRELEDLRREVQRDRR